MGYRAHQPEADARTKQSRFGSQGGSARLPSAAGPLGFAAAQYCQLRCVESSCGGGGREVGSTGASPAFFLSGAFSIPVSVHFWDTEPTIAKWRWYVCRLSTAGILVRIPFVLELSADFRGLGSVWCWKPS